MAETISAIAALLWPLLVFVVLLVFRRPLLRVLDSAERREWTLEVGGQKLSMKELSDQQVRMIVDLQTEVATLRQAIQEDQPTPHTPVNSVLWVDDHPENNALLVHDLQQAGVHVDLALDTHEGLELFDRRRYGAVVSDMGRHEDGGEVSDAGVRLTQAIRETDTETPVLIYCHRRAAARHGDRAYAEGATVVTSSGSVLVGMLQRNEFGVRRG